MRSATLSRLAAIACLAIKSLALPWPQQSPSYSVVDVSGPASLPTSASSTTTVTTIATTATSATEPSTVVISSVTAYTTVTPSVAPQKTIESSVTVLETITAPQVSETTIATTVSVHVTVTPSPKVVTESSTLTITSSVAEISVTVVSETSTVSQTLVSIVPVYSTTTTQTTSGTSSHSTGYSTGPSTLRPANSTSPCTTSSHPYTTFSSLASASPTIVVILNGTLLGFPTSTVPTSTLWSHAAANATAYSGHSTTRHVVTTTEPRTTLTGSVVTQI